MQSRRQVPTDCIDVSRILCNFGASDAKYQKIIGCFYCSADADWIREKIVAKSLEPFRMIEVRSYKFAVRSKAGTEQQLLSSCLPPIQPYLQSVKYGRIFSASQSPDAVDLRPLRSSRAHSAHFAMSYFDLVA